MGVLLVSYAGFPWVHDAQEGGAEERWRRHAKGTGGEALDDDQVLSLHLHGQNRVPGGGKLNSLRLGR